MKCSELRKIRLFIHTHMGLFSLLSGFSKTSENPIKESAIATAIMEKLMGEQLHSATEKLPQSEASLSSEKLSNLLGYPESAVSATLYELESHGLVERQSNGHQISETGIQWFIEHGDWDKTK